MALHNYIYSKHKDSDFAVSKIARDHDPRPISIHPVELESVNLNDQEKGEHEKINNIINNGKKLKDPSNDIELLNLLNNSHIKYNHDEFEDVTSDSDYCDSESSDSHVGLSFEKDNLKYENQSNINGNRNDGENDNEDTSVGNISSNLDKLNCDIKTRWVIKEGKLRKLKSRFDNNKKDKKRRKTKKQEKLVSNLDGGVVDIAENDACSSTSGTKVNIIDKQIDGTNKGDTEGSVKVDS